MATIMEMFLKGLQFSGYGIVSELFDFTNESGERVRMVRFSAAGKTYSLIVETDGEFAKYKSLEGQLVKASGSVLRSKNSSSIRPMIKEIAGSGSPGWKEPAPQELLNGLSIFGVVKMLRKSTGIFNGNTWYKCQFMTMGDVFEVSNIDPAFYQTIPEKSLLQVRFGTAVKLSRNDRNKFSEVDLVIDNFSPVNDDGSTSRREQKAA